MKIPTVVIEASAHRLAHAHTNIRAALGLPLRVDDRTETDGDKAMRLTQFTLVGHIHKYLYVLGL